MGIAVAVWVVELMCAVVDIVFAAKVVDRTAVGAALDNFATVAVGVVVVVVVDKVGIPVVTAEAVVD